MKKLIVTGDDFGFSLHVNEAIEEAHRHGILNCASLMVGAKATRDAVDRARRLPSLRVGLHLVLVDGSPILSPTMVPNLVTKKGEFSSHLVRAGINFFFQKQARRQLEDEIRAQFQAFLDTGLPLDHVNSHHHMHLHPTVLGIILRVGRDYGMGAVRFPYEPPLLSWRASRKRLVRKILLWLFLWPWLTLFKNRLRRARVLSNDFLFGLNDSGNMDADLALQFLKCSPSGVAEIYFHPEISDIPLTEENRFRQREYEALINPDLRQTVLTSGIQLIAFSDIQDRLMPKEA